MWRLFINMQYQCYLDKVYVNVQKMTVLWNTCKYRDNVHE